MLWMKLNGIREWMNLSESSIRRFIRYRNELDLLLNLKEPAFIIRLDKFLISGLIWRMRHSNRSRSSLYFSKTCVVQINTTSKLSINGSTNRVSNALRAWNKSEITKVILGSFPELPLIRPALVFSFKVVTRNHSIYSLLHSVESFAYCRLYPCHCNIILETP